MNDTMPNVTKIIGDAYQSVQGLQDIMAKAEASRGDQFWWYYFRRSKDVVNLLETLIVNAHNVNEETPAVIKLDSDATDGCISEFALFALMMVTMTSLCLAIISVVIATGKHHLDGDRATAAADLEGDNTGRPLLEVTEQRLKLSEQVDMQLDLSMRLTEVAEQKRTIESLHRKLEKLEGQCYAYSLIPRFLGCQEGENPHETLRNIIFKKYNLPEARHKVAEEILGIPVPPGWVLSLEHGSSYIESYFPGLRVELEWGKNALPGTNSTGNILFKNQYITRAQHMESFGTPRTPTRGLTSPPSASPSMPSPFAGTGARNLSPKPRISMEDCGPAGNTAGTIQNKSAQAIKESPSDESPPLPVWPEGDEAMVNASPMEESVEQSSTPNVTFITDDKRIATLNADTDDYDGHESVEVHASTGSNEPNPDQLTTDSSEEEEGDEEDLERLAAEDPRVHPALRSKPVPLFIYADFRLEAYENADVALITETGDSAGREVVIGLVEDLPVGIQQIYTYHTCKEQRRAYVSHCQNQTEINKEVKNQLPHFTYEVNLTNLSDAAIELKAGAHYHQAYGLDRSQQQDRSTEEAKEKLRQESTIQKIGRLGPYIPDLSREHPLWEQGQQEMLLGKPFPDWYPGKYALTPSNEPLDFCGRATLIKINRMKGPDIEWTTKTSPVDSLLTSPLVFAQSRAILPYLAEVCTTDQDTKCELTHRNCTVCCRCLRWTICWRKNCGTCNRALGIKIANMISDENLIYVDVEYTRDLLYHQLICTGELPAAAHSRYPVHRVNSWDKNATIDLGANQYFNKILPCDECHGEHKVASRKWVPAYFLPHEQDYYTVVHARTNGVTPFMMHGYNSERRSTNHWESIPECPENIKLPPVGSELSRAKKQVDVNRLATFHGLVGASLTSPEGPYTVDWSKQASSFRTDSNATG